MEVETFTVLVEGKQYIIKRSNHPICEVYEDGRLLGHLDPKLDSDVGIAWISEDISDLSLIEAIGYRIEQHDM